jgi:hypothetical protein
LFRHRGFLVAAGAEILTRISLALEPRIRSNGAMFAAMLAPYLSGLLGLQSDFGWRTGGVVGDYYFGLPQTLLVAQIAVTTRGV